MANFVFAKYNSMPEQVEENKENIKKLCGYIKDAYHTNNGITLNDTDTTIAISDTNADASTVDGWLFDDNGKLFKITSGDGVNLLIDFCTNFKGADGRDGADDIDDSTTAINKLWSSDKTNNEIINAKDKGIYYTKTQPTVVGSSLYFLDFENEILNINSNIPIIKKDLLLYIDANDKVIELYRVEGLNSLTKLGDFGGEKQLYQHNIRIYSNDTFQELLLKIINDSNTQFDLTSLNTWLSTNGFTETANMYYECSGGKTTGSGSQTFFIVGVCYNNSDNTTLKIRGGQYTSLGTWTITISSVNITDKVVAL